jgi:DNA polymerase I-like protein with 3'-5' exonuclease and polymerase domains/uracil-DNA glycosylase
MSRIKVGSSGPLNARIILVGEAPGKTEEEKGIPFQGTSGIELTKMLAEAGIQREQCYITNVAKYRPPGNDIDLFFGKKTDGLPLRAGRFMHPEIAEGVKELEEEIEKVKPQLIIALGGTPLWALTGKEGISKWRGSILFYNSIPVIPVYHPAGILRNWSWRYITVHDLRRARRLLAGEIKKPKTSYIVRPSYTQVDFFLYEVACRLSSGPVEISVDIETRNQQIACIGLATSATECICIPLMEVKAENQCYWNEDEELDITLKLREILTHPNARVIGQNFSYDAQYFVRQYGYAPRLWRDTMLIHHTLFPGTPKGLDYLASLYLDWYEYWKDESKEWDPRTMPEEQLWEYNCKDAINTILISRELAEAESSLNLRSTSYGAPVEIQMSLFPIILNAMVQGVRVDTEYKRSLMLTLQDQVALREAWLNDVVGRPLNPNSPKQLSAFFYDELGQKKIFNYKAKNPGSVTTNADALELIANREPLLRPIVNSINEIRRLRNALSFVAQPLDFDKRIRCSYNIAGTETFRFASSEDAFGFGTNLQNVTQGEGEQDPAKRGPTEFFIPNLRRLLTPDPGFVLCDYDLKSADAQVVLAESNEWELLDKLRDGFPLHDDNAKRWGIPRPLAKAAVHGTNYGGSAFGLSKNLGLPQDLCQRIIDDWLSRYPGIASWHERTKMELMTRRYVENIFGYRRFYFDRIDEHLLKEALAWRPQSTIAIVTNLGIRQVLSSDLPVHFLLQVHDSSVFQWRKHLDLYEEVRTKLLVKIPYSRELIIDVGGNMSDKSWGHCK